MGCLADDAHPPALVHPVLKGLVDDVADGGGFAGELEEFADARLVTAEVVPDALDGDLGVPVLGVLFGFDGDDDYEAVGVSFLL